MTPLIAFIAAILTPVPAEPNDALDKGFAGALRGCEEWILNPASWQNGTDSFKATVGLGDAMGMVDRVDEAALPPKPLRLANHYWRINSTPDAGYILVVSDRMPMCHVTGGGGSDLQPAIQRVLASADFARRWTVVAERSRADMVTTSFRNRMDAALTIEISRAKRAGGRQDRVQLLATAQYAVRK